MLFGKSLGIGSVACGALIASCGLVSVVGAQPRDPAVSVADDGSEVPAARRSATTTSRSFPGEGRDLRLGEKDDGRATPRSRLEEEGLERRLRNAKPIRSPSAREERSSMEIETVIGSDDRTRVSPTTTYPARATVLILFRIGGADFLCSGFMISDDTVATAGHCVAPGNGRGFYNSATYQVFPGRNGYNSTPYGSCNARRLYSVNGWLNQGRDDFDYGAIKLDCTVGTTTGWYGYTSGYGGIGTPLVVQGYPGDKPLTQWQSKDKVVAQNAGRVYYRADTTGGMSGSPVWVNKNAGCPRCAIAIHAYGIDDRPSARPPDSNSNHGTRINPTVADNLTAWKNAP